MCFLILPQAKGERPGEEGTSPYTQPLRGLWLLPAARAVEHENPPLQAPTHATRIQKRKLRSSTWRVFSSFQMTNMSSALTPFLFPIPIAYESPVTTY